MNNFRTLQTAAGFSICTLLATALVAADPAPMEPTASLPVCHEDELPEREIFVPLSDLHVILLSDVQRVFMTRQEYEALAARARAVNRPSKSTQPAAILSADYAANIEENRARLLSTIVVSASDDSLSAVELDLSDVALRSATLDGKDAALGRNPAGVPVLFVSGAGRHELKLEILAAVETATAERILSFQVPTPPATRLRLTVPGQVEIKSGATIIRRTVDEERQVTQFDLLPRRGRNSLALSLNNRQLQKDRVMLAHAVAIDEITGGYERLHVTASISVLHGATDRFRFAVPEGFEVTGVSAPEVARWSVSDAEPQADVPHGRVLEVFLREPATAVVSLNISAARWSVPLEKWRLPKLTALDVAGEATVVGILLENRLQPSDLQPTGLIPIDASILSQALPASVLESRSGAPPLVPVAAFYAPRAQYDLQASFAAPPPELRVTTNVLLSLTDEKLQARGGFALLAATDKLVEFDFTAPAGWQVTEVRPEGGAPLPLETYPAAEGATRVHVRLPSSVPVGQSRDVYFRAVSWPAGWLDEWQTRSVEFPVFQLLGATRDVGAIAVQTLGDMSVVADQADRLTPLDSNEKAKYGLEDVSTQLAFRYAAPPYTLSLTASRIAPRLTARTFSFFRAESETIAAHYEIAYDVSEARTSRLAFELPASTPAELSVRGLDGVSIKESSSELAAGWRRWTVELAESRRGSIRLAIDFQQPLPSSPSGDKSTPELPLPLVRALGVAYQSGVVAVEGTADRDVQVKTSLRKVDVGELAEADYQPGRRLLGAFGYGGGRAEIQLLVARPIEYELPTAIVERAELLTSVASGGRSQTAARFRLRAKALLIEVQLPPGSTLWGAFLDSQSTLPQRGVGGLLIELPAGAADRPRDLQLIYETPIDRIRGLGSLDLAAPKLLLRSAASSTGSPVPLADLVWILATPLGLDVVASNGTVFSDEIGIRPMSVGTIAMSDTTPFDPIRFDTHARRGADHADQKTAAAEATTEEAKSEMPSEDYDARGLGDMSIEMAADDPFAAPMPIAGKGPGVPTDGQAVLRAGGGMGGGIDGAGKQAAIKQPANTPSQWALEGLRSLPIELQANSPSVMFQSLGSEPRLSAMLVERSRVFFVGWAAALLILLRGVWLTTRPRWQRLRFVGLALAIAYVLPLVLPYSDLLEPICSMAFYAACALAVYYPLAAALRFMARAIRGDHHFATSQAASSALLLALLAPLATQADEPPTPVTVPADAIIVPYDPALNDPLAALQALLDPDKAGAAQNRGFAIDKSQKILVPFGKYTELLRIVEGAGKRRSPPPAEYVLAGGRFDATLDGGQSLLVKGLLDIDVLVDRAVSVSLPLNGGVLTNLRVETAAAKVEKTDEADLGPTTTNESARPNPAAAPQVADTPLAVVVSGLGRHRLELDMRFRIVSRGGWQIVEGQLPVPVAAALTLRVPKAETEVVLSGGVDRGTIETKRHDETIATALSPDGRLHVEWRPKLGGAPVDNSLTAAVSALWDVQEGGLRLLWHVDLTLRGAERENFSLDVPSDYLVEKVTGANVRGWRLVKAEGRQQLEVSLLKAAAASESFAVALSRHGAVGTGDLTQFSAPVLSVSGAAQQSGELAIRRSPLLQLRTEQIAGVSRADGSAPALERPVDADESPLGILPYQFYRFAAVPFTVKLSARPAVPHVTALLQTVLKISERQRTLESRIRLLIDERPIFRLRIGLPEDWKLDRVVAPQPLQWVIGKDGDRRILDLYFAGGQRQSLDVVLSGTLGDYGPLESLTAPKLEVLAVDDQTGGIEQTGHIVVAADPALGIRADKLTNCETELLSAVGDWLAPAQQALVRLALRYRTPDYSAELHLVPRKPAVHVTAVSNVRISERSVEETILLDFAIQEAGIRSLSFVLPANMTDARISAPMLRQKTITPLAEDKAGRIRVRLELQEEVIGNLRVLVEDDRLLADDKYLAPIPQVETGQTDHRYVTLETAGRDEIVVAEQQGVETVSSEQADWRMLSAMLGRGLTQAYQVQFGAVEPRLVLRAQDRQAVVTAGARIGLAKATLMIDEQGAFRGSQLYRVDNSLEQYLVVRLPEGADLWTAHVAGDPVKPAADQAPRTVRIPLVKTAPGDADFPVVLKYGGRLGRLGPVDRVDFPLMRTVNIHVELSQVELYAPESYDWFDFGGTMRLVESEGYLTAGLLEYNSRQIGLAMQSLSSSDSYARTRAAANLKGLQVEAQQLKRSAGSYARNDELAQQLRSNAQIQEGLAQSQLEQPEPAVAEQQDNRGRLGEFYRTQSGSRANDVVNGTGESFQQQAAATQAPPAKPAAPGQNFSPEWLAKNGLKSAPAALRVNMPPGNAPPKIQIDFAAPVMPQSKMALPRPADALPPQHAPQSVSQPAAPALADNESQRDADNDQQTAQRRESAGKKAKRQLQRYAERVAQQQLDFESKESGAAASNLGRPAQPAEDSAPAMPARSPQPGVSLSESAIQNMAALQQPTQTLPSAALASLDVELNPRGKKYLFTTPRGDVEVTARAISVTLLGRALRVAGVAVLVALVYAVTRRRPQLPAARNTAPAQAR